MGKLQLRILVHLTWAIKATTIFAHWA